MGLIGTDDKPIKGVLNTLDLSQGLDFKKYYAGEGVNRLGGNKGHINTNGVGSGGAETHESLHFAGIKDRSDEKPGDPKRGRRATSEYDGGSSPFRYERPEHPKVIRDDLCYDA